MKKVLIILDPIETLIYSRDTSYMLGFEGVKFGWQCYYATINDLFLQNSTCMAHNQQFNFTLNKPFYEFTADKNTNSLADFDLVLMRKDPPLDLNFIIATQFLSFTKTLVLNNPFTLRERIEKLYPLLFPGVFPPCLLSCDKKLIIEFLAQHNNIVIKPINDRGGAGVLLLNKDEINVNSAIDILTKMGQEHIMAQLYLPQIKQGDVRAFTFDGVYAGGLKRVPASNEIRSNLHIGAKGYNAEITTRQAELIEIIGPQLKQDGVFFAGIDLIGDYITEINITSPTGIRAYLKVSGINLALNFWQEIEKKL